MQDPHECIMDKITNKRRVDNELGKWWVIQRLYQLSKVLDSNMVCWNLCHAYLLEVGLMQILVEHETLSIICHVGIHVDFSSMVITLALKPSPSSVKWTWTFSAFWTNERFENAMVTNLQAHVWSGPQVRQNRLGQKQTTSMHALLWRRLAITLHSYCIRHMGLKWLLFLIGSQDLIDMWFCKDQRVNIIKTHV